LKNKHHHRIKTRAGLLSALRKPVRATVAKEVGMKNPAEKTTVRPNQNLKTRCFRRASKSHLRGKP
jgi:hypothetical protein